MGNKTSSKQINPNSKLNRDSNCPYCFKAIGKENTYSDLRLHLEQCTRKANTPIQIKNINIENSMSNKFNNNHCSYKNLASVNSSRSASISHNPSTNNSIRPSPIPSPIINKPQKVNIQPPRTFNTNTPQFSLNKINNNNVSLSQNTPFINLVNSNSQVPLAFNQLTNNGINRQNLTNNIQREIQNVVISNPQSHILFMNNNYLQASNQHDNYTTDMLFQREKKLYPSPVKPKEAFSSKNLPELGIIKMQKLPMEKPNIPFEKKLEQFRTNMQTLKIDWRDGFCTLVVDRNNILQESIKQLKKIDLYKELHINFKGEISNDAGGLIREFFSVVFKEIQKEENKFFEKSETDDFSYKINKELRGKHAVLEVFNFIGKIIAKALMDNLTINTCFNKYIYKLMLDEDIKENDLVFIDKPLYYSFKELNKLEDVSDLGLYFCLQNKIGEELVTEDLVKGGSNIPVTNNNLRNYIQRRIEYIQKKDLVFINEIKSGLFSVIPEKYISIFTADEFELLLNGQPFIDIIDWIDNTNYSEGYEKTTPVIQWFWDIISELSQEELGKFIQFCTGSSRIPIGGFSVLESNRGEVSRFTIVKAYYYPNKINFIKAHTCFNRIDLPLFPEKPKLLEAIRYIINNEVIGFGID